MSTPRIRPFAPFLVAILVLAACSDDDPVKPPADAGIHGLVMKDGDPYEGASVYLAREPGFPPIIAPIVVDSTFSDPDGRYGFEDLDPGLYRTYAAVWDESDQSLVSAFTGVLERMRGMEIGKTLPEYTGHELRGISFDGEVAGDVWIEGETAAPVDSARVTLLRYVGAQLVPEGETWTDAAGGFAIDGTRTGNYTAYAIKEWPFDAPFPLFMSGETEPVFCDGASRVVLPRMWLYESMVEKPAIYIDPERPGDFRVELVLDHGTRLTRSEPDYGDGWEVAVDPGGLIDGRWDYLFYEVAISAWPRLERGWCVAREDLARSLADIGSDFGLKANERDDFLDYWAARLPRYDWYLIKPVSGPPLDTWVGLRVRPAPDTLLRFWLFFQGSDVPVDLEPPPVLRVGRTGTAVVEWGGTILPTRGS